MNNIKNEVVEELQKRYPNAEVKIEEVVKFNQVKTGIFIHEEGINAVPMMYVEDYDYEVLTAKQIADKVQRTYEENKFTNIDMEWLHDWNQARNKLRPKLINSKWNKEFLDNMVSFPFVDDLSVMFYIDVYDERIGQGTVNVRKENLLVWDVTPEVVRDCANANVRAKVDVIEFGPFMKIITTEDKIFGAGVVPLVLETVAREFKDFYLIPSSVHECLVFPYLESAFKDADEMIRSTNAEMVAPSERLSDHAYLFMDGEFVQR